MFSMDGAAEGNVVIGHFLAEYVEYMLEHLFQQERCPKGAEMSMGLISHR